MLFQNRFTKVEIELSGVQLNNIDIKIKVTS